MNIILLNYVRRYWLLGVVLAVFVLVALNGTMFNLFGTVLYLPMLVVACEASALLIRNIIYKDTSDFDADTGKYIEDWRSLDPKTRVIITVVQHGILFLGSCIIAFGLL